MSFTEAKTFEAHLRDLLSRAASTRPVELFTGFAKGGIHSARWSRL